MDCINVTFLIVIQNYSNARWYHWGTLGKECRYALYYFLQLCVNLQLSEKKKVLKVLEYVVNEMYFVKEEVQYGCYFLLLLFQLKGLLREAHIRKANSVMAISITEIDFYNGL